MSGTPLDVAVSTPRFDPYRALSVVSRVALPVCFVPLWTPRLGMLRCAQFPGAAPLALFVSAAALWRRRRRESRTV